MNEFMEFLTSNEMTIVGLIAAIGCFLGLIVFIFEKTYYIRKRRHNTRELNNLIEDVSSEMENIENSENVTVYAVENDIKEQPVVETVKEVIPIVEKQEEVVPIVDNKVDNSELIEVLEPIANLDIENIEDSNKEEIIEEKPLVIPIEEYEEAKRIEQIYSAVKEEVEVLNSKQEEKLEYTDIEPNKEEAIEELKKATEELLLKEENKDNNKIELTKFEEEQEENAIISVDELLKRGNELYEKNEVTQYEDEGDEPISLQDLELRMKNIKSEMEAIENSEKINLVTDNTEYIEQHNEVDSIKEEQTQKVVLDDFNTIDNSDKIYRDDIVFKSSPIISPIFGIEEVQTSNDMMFENTANYEKFDEEIRKTNEFIVTLKELQGKLD